MMRFSVRGIVLLLAGLAILAAAMVYGGTHVPHLREDMVEIGVRPTVLGAVTVGLYFGAVAMLAFAAIVLMAAVNAFRGKPQQAAVLWVVAASYVLFGVWRGWAASASWPD